MLFRFLQIVSLAMLTLGARAAPPLELSVQSRPTAAAPRAEGAPVVEIDSLVFDFGAVRPKEVRSHTFKVRNAGGVPLRIYATVTSCKCLSAKMSDEVIEPGASATLSVVWRGTEDAQRNYRQTIRMATNDPLHEIIELRVIGDVAQEFELNPNPVYLLPSPEDPAELRGVVRVTSLHWPEFEVEASGGDEALRTQISLDKDPINAAPEDSESELQEGPAAETKPKRTVRRVEVSAKKSELGRRTEFTLSLLATPKGATEGRTLGVAVRVEPLDAVQLLGVGVDEVSGVVKLGAVSSSQGSKRRFLLKIRGAAEKDPLRSVHVEPAGWKLETTPLKQEGGRWLYRLDLVVPPGGVVRPMLRESSGFLRLELDHPFVPQWTIRLEALPSG